MSTGPCYHSRMNAICRVACLLGLTALMSPLPAPAQQSGATLYAVEIIVFRDSSVGANEDWTAAPQGRGFGNESTRGGTPQVLRVLPPSDYKLATIEATLRSSGAWRPIAHAAWVQTAANWGTHLGIALADLGINSPGLSGTIYLERASYLHLGVNLNLSGSAATYAINEMRSVKYNERQYFDHPAFGVIAVVSPASPAAGAATR
jgi:Peptidoglycan-binding protein, CsiV